ncbi:MAG: hypothetical protein Gyms2KO_40700 [Gymnodinialimonas sp.]
MKVSLIRVFVSSPGDLSIERDLVRKVVGEINSDLGTIHSFRLECLMWEDLSSRISRRPQESISAAFDEFEIFLGLMGFYFGTPTGDFGSGTEEEYTLALKNWNEKRLEFIQFYFSAAKVDANLLDLDQVKKVREFREAVGRDGVLFDTFTDLKVLEARVRSALIADVYRFLEKPEERSRETASAAYRTLNPYGNMKALDKLMQERPEAAINFLAHAGATSMQSSQMALEKITRKLSEVGRKATKFTRSAADLQRGKRKEKMVTKHLVDLYEGIESLLRAFASETPALDKNFSDSISSFHRAAEIATNLSEEDQKALAELLGTLDSLKLSMQSTSNAFVELAMPDVPELGHRWEVSRLTLDAVVSDFRDFISRGTDAIDVVAQALSSRKLPNQPL